MNRGEGCIQVHVQIATLLLFHFRCYNMLQCPIQFDRSLGKKQIDISKERRHKK